MRITIIYNKPVLDPQNFQRNASEEDTETAALLAQKTLTESGHTVSLLPVTFSTLYAIGSVQADCIINFIEYTGKDLQYVANAFLELRKLGIPFTGSTFETYTTTANKITMKTAMDMYKIPTPIWQLFDTGTEKLDSRIPFPQIVKLAHEHCGVGLTNNAITSNVEETYRQISALLREYNQPVIVEEYIDGRELQVTLIQDQSTVRMLPIAEYVFPKKQKVKILTYESRWTSESQNQVIYDVVLATLSPKVQKQIEAMCIYAYNAFGFTNYARFDLRLMGTTPYILETNANPGLDDDPENGLVLSFREAGMNYSAFLNHILKDAISHPIYK